jgi:heme/copper-type cytochrome/quinol oxidase subunit 1
MRIGWWLLAAGLVLLIVSALVNLASDQGWFRSPDTALVEPVTAGDIAAVITSVSGLIAALAGLITALTGLMKARRTTSGGGKAADT